MGRQAVIENNVAAVRERVREACTRSGRKESDVTVIAVSKRFPVADISSVFETGIRHFGESRVQEFTAKFDEWSAAGGSGDLVWHMVGHLQRNKARDIIGRASLFHGLDSLRLARALDGRATEVGAVVPCLVQVNVSGEQSKFGFGPEEIDRAAAELADCRGLRIEGMMTLARPADEPEAVRPEFARLRDVFERIRSSVFPHMRVLSMGMSGDFEVAIEEGATHIRIGTAIFGERPDAD